MAAWLWVLRGRLGSGFEARTTAAGVLEVLAEALRVAPGLAQAEVREKSGLGCVRTRRIICRCWVLFPIFKNIYLATGHGPTGLQLGPYSGKLIADLVLGKDLETGIDAYQITRFL